MRVAVIRITTDAASSPVRKLFGLDTTGSFKSWSAEKISRRLLLISARRNQKSLQVLVAVFVAPFYNFRRADIRWE